MKRTRFFISIGIPLSKNLLHNKTSFKIGVLATTDTIHNMMLYDSVFKAEVQRCIDLFCVKEWGNVNWQRQVQNEFASIFRDNNIIGLYHTSCGRVCIKTEPKRNITTISFLKGSGKYKSHE